MKIANQMENHTFPGIVQLSNPLYDMLQTLDSRIYPTKVLGEKLGIHLDYKQETQSSYLFRVVISINVD